MIFVKLVDGFLENAPDSLVEKDEIIVNPTQSKYLEHGYKLYIDNIPSYDSNTEQIFFVGYEETETEIISKYRVDEYIPEPTQEDYLLELDFRIAMIEIQLNG